MASAPPIDPAIGLSDSALRLQEAEAVLLEAVESQKKRDEALARILQQTESQEKERKLAQEKADADVALQLLVEEKLRIAREDELKKVSEQVAKNMQLDEARLAEEEERKRLVEKDLELAKKLAQELYFSIQRRLHPAFHVSRPTVLTTAQEKVRLATLNAHKYQVNNTAARFNSARQHAVAIHNNHCRCYNTATCNNNHIYQVHNRYCAKSNCICREVIGTFNNKGELHKHDSRCCVVNHFHTAACTCIYRNHLLNTGHTSLCCQLNHLHNDYCDCICK